MKPRKKKTLVASEGISPAVFTPKEPAPKPAGYVFGRPTSYDPAYCEVAVNLGRQGKSKTYIAGSIGVTRQTLDNWALDYPDFFNAIMLAKTLEQMWWEDAGQNGEGNGKIGQGIWTRNMAARFRDDWTERQEISGPSGGAIQHEHIDRPEKESREEWIARRQRELATSMGASTGASN